MYSLKKYATLAAMLACFVVLAASFASAQVLNSGAQAIALNATLNESLTVGLSANTVNFPLTAGSAANAGSTNITATTTWVLKPSRTALKVYAYFATTTALTDGAGNNIPSTAFFIADNAGPSNALVNTVAFGGANAGLQLANVAITNANRAGNRADIMAFNINL